MKRAETSSALGVVDIALGRVPAAAGGKPALERDRVGDLRARVLGVEVDDGVEAVAVAVDVGGVGVDVLAQRVGVLDQEAQRLRVVGRDERAGRGERGGVLPAGRLAGSCTVAPTTWALRMVCSRSSAAWIASGVVTARPPRTRRARWA